MKIGDEKYEPVNTEGNSAFEIPVTVFDYKQKVIADTIAMSTVSYTHLYTQMINSMKVEAQMEQLLPLKKEDFSNVAIPADIHQEEIQMVPSPTAVMDHVVPNYVTGFIFGALVESFCSEQNARMMAMQSASDNAAELLNDLSIEYNRVRQAAITQEITEVVGGARAQRKKKR